MKITVFYALSDSEGSIKTIQALIFLALVKTQFKKKSGLSATKALQDTDIPVKILKENADYFAEFICTQFNKSIKFFKITIFL